MNTLLQLPHFSFFNNQNYRTRHSSKRSCFLACWTRHYITVLHLGSFSLGTNIPANTQLYRPPLSPGPSRHVILLQHALMLLIKNWGSVSLYFPQVYFLPFFCNFFFFFFLLGEWISKVLTSFRVLAIPVTYFVIEILNWPDRSCPPEEGRLYHALNCGPLEAHSGFILVPLQSVKWWGKYRTGSPKH